MANYDFLKAHAWKQAERFVQDTQSGELLARNPERRNPNSEYYVSEELDVHFYDQAQALVQSGQGQQDWETYIEEQNEECKPAWKRFLGW